MYLCVRSEPVSAMDNKTLIRLQKLTEDCQTVYAVEVTCDGETDVSSLWETRAAAEIARDAHNSMAGNKAGYYGKARVLPMKLRTEAIAREFYQNRVTG